MTVTVVESTAPAAQGAPTDTSRAFVTGQVASGTVTAATLVRNIKDFEGVYGTRTGGSIAMWDWLDLAFREGLTEAYVGGYTAAGDHVSGLALFPAKLGPGQVVIVGETAGPTTYQAIADHANANNRIGLLDVLVTDDTLAELALHGTDAKALTGSLENIGVFGSFVNTAGPAGVTGSSGRLLPASAVIAGLCSRVDQQGNPNRAAGGRDFPLRYTSGFVYDPTESERSSLFGDGVNMFKN